MAFRLCVRGTNAISEIQTGTALSTTTSPEWNVEVATDGKALKLRLVDPFTDASTFGTEPENGIKWYLETHIAEPFETTKAEFAAEALAAYGRKLAAQLVQTNLLPKSGDIELEIAANDRVGTLDSANISLEGAEIDLQHLHWEVLEDVTIWPSAYDFKSVSVIRTVPRLAGMNNNIDERPKGKKFKILLVVSRPGQANDIDYQLVSRCLVAILSTLSKTNPTVNASLTVLRPPTWRAFKENLQEHDYDIVHLDMHGQVKNTSKGIATAVVAFCRPGRENSLKMKKDWKTGEEIGRELANADVKTVVLNACDSASFQHSNPESNLAEVLLRHGIQSVLAMAYRVVDEAVEKFMNVFYQRILINEASFQDAARLSRLALMKNRSRRAAYMHTVQLCDYIVPVLYTQSLDSKSVETLFKQESSKSRFSYWEKALNSIKHVLPAKRAAYQTITSTRQDLIGRDTDIMSLEILLSVTRVVLLHGQGGCGKSALLRYLCQWWEDSGWIKGSVFVDFSDKEGFWLDDIMKNIGAQLGLDPENYSETEIINTFTSGKFLLVLDSVDTLDTPVLVDSLLASPGLAKQLQPFIDAITRENDGSMVILASRIDTVPFSNIRSEGQKYHLGGISVLESVDLLQELALEPKAKLPESYHRRENIDFLRRVAVLLEGNPAAIQMIVPAMRKAKFNGETLLNTLLYGICDTNEDEWRRCRFVRSIYGTMLHSFNDPNETLISTWHFAVFWTIMPKDLKYYHWFLYLSQSKYLKEGTYLNWISKKWQDLVENAQVTQTLRKHWPGLEAKFLKVGILEHATMKTRQEQSLSCYHIHPIYTLLARSAMSTLVFKEAKFAYVRQALLWDKRWKDVNSFRSIEWGDTEQHEDYLHNTRAVAMAWSLEGDLQDEVKRMGLSIFDLTYDISIDSLYVNQRQPKLFIPLIWTHLLRLYMLTTLIRPNEIPLRSDVAYILSYSWTLCRLSTDDNEKSGLVEMALEATENYKAGSASNYLDPPQELCWFQLRHAEANIAESKSTIYRAKELYERNLSDDPLTTETKMYNAIRRWQFQNLNGWSSCVLVIAAQEGKLDKEKVTSRIRQFLGEFSPGNMANFLSNAITDHKELIPTITCRDYFSFVLEREEKATSKFGTLTNHILDSPMMNVFVDLADDFGVQPSELLPFLYQQANSDTPMGTELKAMMTSMEYRMRMISADDNAAAALNFNIQREALSSTTSTGWENFADLHMQMYHLTVTRNENPDYQKGLTHLEEWWKQHQGIGVSKQDLCYGHLKYAVCYNGLNMTSKSARAVLKISEVFGTMKNTDLREAGANLGEFAESLKQQLGLKEASPRLGDFAHYLLQEIAALDKLHIFLDQRIIFSASTSTADLAWQERNQMHHIMKKSQKLVDDRKRCEEQMEEAWAALDKTKDLLKSLERTSDSAESSQEDGKKERSWDDVLKRMDDLRDMRDMVSKQKQVGKSKFWLG